MENQAPKSASGEHATCIVSGSELPKQNMLRLVLSPDGVLVCDVKGKLPVDGVYIQSDSKILQIGLEQKLIAKHLSANLPDDFDIPHFMQNIKKQLYKRIAEWLCMANKSGALTTGFMKVESALRNEEVRLLVQAKDASNDGRKKLRNIAVRDEVAIDESLSLDFLSDALGKSNAVHIGILTKVFSTEILRESSRLAGFCEKDGL